MKLLLKNVRLETGYQFSNGNVIKTETDIFDVLIENGVFLEISDIILETKNYTIVDAKQQLLVPSFIEKHTHLDKTYFGKEWIAPMPTKGGIFSRMDEEALMLPQELDNVEKYADNMIKHYIRNGHTHIRTHVNVDPHIKTEHIQKIKNVLANYDDIITYEIVAFPQHGLLRNGTDFLEVMDEALALGVTHIGGVDPAMVDRNINKFWDTILDYAEKYDIGIDIHLHDKNTLGAFEINRLIDKVEQRNFKNDITISHAFALADLSDNDFTSLISRMKKQNIHIASTVAMGPVPITVPIYKLKESGIDVSVVHDSLIDHWSPFGTGDSIEKMNYVVERFGITDEYGLSQSLSFITGGITPLDEKGHRVWPQVGDCANCLLVDAISSAHMIARRTPISTVISSGKIIHQEKLDLKGGKRE